MSLIDDTEKPFAIKEGAGNGILSTSGRLGRVAIPNHVKTAPAFLRYRLFMNQKFSGGIMQNSVTHRIICQDNGMGGMFCNSCLIRR